MQSDAIFKNMPVGRAILTLAVPSVFSVLVMILYNMADLFFVARLGDNAQVAAVSIVGPIFSLLSAVIAGIAVFEYSRQICGGNIAYPLLFKA